MFCFKKTAFVLLPFLLYLSIFFFFFSCYSFCTRYANQRITGDVHHVSAPLGPFSNTYPKPFTPTPYVPPVSQPTLPSDAPQPAPETSAAPTVKPFTPTPYVPPVSEPTLPPEPSVAPQPAPEPSAAPPTVTPILESTPATVAPLPSEPATSPPQESSSENIAPEPTQVPSEPVQGVVSAEVPSSTDIPEDALPVPPVPLPTFEPALTLAPLVSPGGS